MAVNKNFVVKNGLEVAVDALTVEASTKKVGLGTINPTDTLDLAYRLITGEGLYLTTADADHSTAVIKCSK